MLSNYPLPIFPLIEYFFRLCNMSNKWANCAPQELFSICNPIVTKPKPKVELPKEDKPAEQNGPVNGQESTEAEAGGDKKEPTDGAEPTNSKPDMDLD